MDNSSESIKNMMPSKVLKMVELANEIVEEEHQYITIITTSTEQGRVVMVNMVDSMHFSAGGGGAGSWSVSNGVWSEMD